MSITFFVPGLPIAKGSAKGFYNKHLGRVMILQTNREKQRPWASMISYMAQEAGVTQHDGPVYVGMVFYFPRPKAHYKGKARVLRDDAPSHHTVKPDVDKLVRCVFDALTMAWRDDSQGQIFEAKKLYTEDRPGVEITIRKV